MLDLEHINLVVAKLNSNGESEFVDGGKPYYMNLPDVVEGAFLWGTSQAAHIPADLGTIPEDPSFPVPGATRFGLMKFAPHSAGKLDMSLMQDDAVLAVDPVNRSMHRTATIDYEIVISGKIDLVLESGDTRTLVPGSCVVMGGATHSWANPYDEPCVCALVIIGAGSAL